MDKMDRRAIKNLEIETRGEGQAPVLTGYAAVFNSASEDLGGFTEVIKPGAFARTLKENPDIYALADHDTSKRLARSKNGSLRLSEDKKGLKVEIDMADTTLGKDTLEEVRTGLLDAMSFGFNVKSDTWEDNDGVIRRTLNDVNLFEVSAVAFPAYRATTIEATRSLEQWRKSEFRGKNLSGLLNRLIESMVDDQTSKSDIKARMGRAAGISEGAVGQILSGGIDCPPLNRLKGFADVLGVSLSRIQNAAESDGCSYDSGGRSISCGFNKVFSPTAFKLKKLRNFI